MEVILLEKIRNLGDVGQVVNVKDGYGRNFLIPKGLGVLATESAMKVLNENLKQQTQKEEQEIAAATKTAEALPNLTVLSVTFHS